MEETGKEMRRQRSVHIDDQGDREKESSNGGGGGGEKKKKKRREGSVSKGLDSVRRGKEGKTEGKTANCRRRGYRERITQQRRGKGNEECLQWKRKWEL